MNSPGNDLTITLPTEVLTMILPQYMLLVLESHRLVRVRASWTSERSAIVLVCKRWRDIALNTSYLWSTISVGWPLGYVKMALKRAAGAPLTVVGKVGKGTHNLKPVARLLAQSSKIREIAIEMDCRHISPFVKGACLPAPLLERLDISVEFMSSPGTQLMSTSFDESVNGFRLNLFNGTRPALRAVRLCCIHVNLTTTIFSDLTSLELIGRSDYASTRPKVQDLCRLFEQCISLLNLRMSEMCPDGHNSLVNASTPPDIIFKLPGLRTLSIEDKICPLTHFLRHLDIPEQTQVDIRAQVTSFINRPEEASPDLWSVHLPLLVAAIQPNLHRSCCKHIEISDQLEAATVSLLW